MRAFRILAVLAALALIGAACGNDDDDNGTDDNGDVTPTTVDDNGTTDLSLSQVVSNTIDEDSADYTITVVRGSLQDVLNGRATGTATGDDTTTTTEDDDDGVLDDDDDGTADDTTTTTEDGDNGILDDDNGTNGTTGDDAREGEVDGTVNWSDDARRVMLPTDNGDREVIVSGSTVYVQLPDDFEGGQTTAGQTDNGEATNDDDDDDGILDNGVTGDDNGEWGQIELDDLLGSMSTDHELLVALHDPSSVLRALNQADTDTQTGQPSDEVDGRDTIHWTVQISADDLDDPVLEELFGEGIGTRDGATTDGATGTGTDTDTDADNGTTDGAADGTDDGATGGAAAQTEADTDNGLETDNGTTDDNGATATDDDNGVTTTTEDDATGTDDGMTTDMGDVEVHVWADEDDEQIVQIAYELGGMNGTAGQYAVVVEFDDLGTDDDIDTPDTDEVRNLQAADLQQLFADVVIIENGVTTGTGTGNGTGGAVGTDDDDDDDDGLFDDDDDDDADDTTTTTQG